MTWKEDAKDIRLAFENDNLRKDILMKIINRLYKMEGHIDDLSNEIQRLEKKIDKEEIVVGLE